MPTFGLEKYFSLIMLLSRNLAINMYKHHDKSRFMFVNRVKQLYGCLVYRGCNLSTNQRRQ